MDILFASHGIINDVLFSAQHLINELSLLAANAGIVVNDVRQTFDTSVLDVIVTVCVSVGLALVVWILMLMPRFKHPEIFDKLITFRYAHRGLHDDIVPENSLAAFRKAMEKGYASELDVMLSKDGRLVIMHDYSLKRMCGVDKEVGDVTSDELDQLRLLDTDEKIPYLEEVLEMAEGKMPLLIEIKATVKNCFELMEKTFELLDNYKGDYCIESFDPRVLLWLRWYRKDVMRGQLSGYINKHGQKLFFLGDFALSFLLVNCVGKPDFIAYNYLDKSSPALRLCNSLYKPKIFYWTIKNKDQQKEVESKNSCIIFEDFNPKDN